LIVLHTAEGALTYQSLGGFFGQSSSQVSSQVGTDDTPNTVGEYVSRGNKAWTQSEFNPVATSNELCGFVAWSRDEWMNNHHVMLENCAKWIAEEAAHFNIPIVKLSPSDAQGSGRGVCDHRSLGPRGGGHSDVGDNFPFDYVIDMAKGGAQQPATEDTDMIASGIAANGNFHVFRCKGKVVSFCWQAANSTGWSGGEAGKAIASFQRFGEVPSEIIGVTCEVAKSNGNFHVFVTCENGRTYFTFQKKNESGWSGGSPGKTIAGFQQFAA
jgi:hypothetical protein